MQTRPLTPGHSSSVIHLCCFTSLASQQQNDSPWVRAAPAARCNLQQLFGCFKCALLCSVPLPHRNIIATLGNERRRGTHHKSECTRFVLWSCRANWWPPRDTPQLECSVPPRVTHETVSLRPDSAYGSVVAGCSGSGHLPLSKSDPSCKIEDRLTCDEVAHGTSRSGSMARFGC